VPAEDPATQGLVELWGKFTADEVRGAQHLSVVTAGARRQTLQLFVPSVRVSAPACVAKQGP